MASVSQHGRYLLAWPVPAGMNSVCYDGRRMSAWPVSVSMAGISLDIIVSHRLTYIFSGQCKLKKCNGCLIYYYNIFSFVLLLVLVFIRYISKHNFVIFPAREITKIESN